MSFGESFLENPDLFPARSSGEPWGESTLALDLPGGPFRLGGMSVAMAERTRRRFGPLASAVSHAPLAGGVSPAPLAGAVSDTPPKRALGRRVLASPSGVELLLFRAPASDFRTIETAGWVTRFDLDPAPASIRIAGHPFMARLDWQPSLGAALWTSTGEDADPRFEGVLENVLRVAVAHRVVEEGGALLHSAAVAVDGAAWLFLGPSGAGKTTLSRLSAELGLEVLSDELNAIRLDGGEAVLERLPFAGDFGLAAAPRERFPLAGVFELAKGRVPKREPIPKSRALGRLVACAPFVASDPFRGDRLLANLERLAAAFPLERLTFAPDPGFWSILKSVHA